MVNKCLAGRPILIVEDNVVIALDLQSAFEDAGAVVFVANDLSNGMHIAMQGELSAAVVDFGLGADNAKALIDHLAERNTPFVLHSGYDNLARAGDKGIVIPKPAQPEMLVDAIAAALLFKEAVILSLQAHPHRTAFGPERISDIHRSFDDGWKSISVARDQVRETATRFANVLLDVAVDDRLGGGNLTLTAIHVMQARSLAIAEEPQCVVCQNV